jgi:hypothetical protein
MQVQRGASTAMKDLIDTPCSAETIIARCLRNLQHAYRQEDQPEHAALMADLHGSVPDAGPDGEQP